jgi:hypothetical protein
MMAVMSLDASMAPGSIFRLLLSLGGTGPPEGAAAGREEAWRGAAEGTGSGDDFVWVPDMPAGLEGWVFES